MYVNPGAGPKEDNISGYLQSGGCLLACLFWKRKKKTFLYMSPMYYVYVPYTEQSNVCIQPKCEH